MGSHVWVEDQAEAWIDGVVTRVDGQKIQVESRQGKSVSFYNCMLK